MGVLEHKQRFLWKSHWENFFGRIGPYKLLKHDSRKYPFQWKVPMQSRALNSPSDKYVYLSRDKFISEISVLVFYKWDIIIYWTTTRIRKRITKQNIRTPCTAMCGELLYTHLIICQIIKLFLRFFVYLD